MTLSPMCAVSPQLLHPDASKTAKHVPPPTMFYTPAEHIEVLADYSEVKVLSTQL